MQGVRSSSLRHWRRNVLFGGAFVDPVAESDYYVDAVNGNDTAPTTGTIDDPFQTAIYAASRASTGQSIGFMGGDVPAQYHYCYQVGAVNKVLTFRRAPYHDPVIRGGTEYHGAGDFSKTIGQTNVYQATTTINTIYCLLFNGWPTHYPMGEVASIAACDALENSFYLDAGANLIYVHVNGGGAPDHVWISATVNRPFITSNGSSGIHLEYLTFKFGCGVHTTVKALGTNHENTFRNLVIRQIGSRAGNTDACFRDLWSSGVQIYENIDHEYTYNKGTGSGAIRAGQGILQEKVGGNTYIINNCSFKHLSRAYYGQHGIVYFNGWEHTNCILRTEVSQEKFFMRDFLVYDCPDNHLEIRSLDVTMGDGVVWLENDPGTGQPLGIVLHEGGVFRLYDITIEGFKNAIVGGSGFYFGTDETVIVRNCASVNNVNGFTVPVANTPTLDLDNIGIYDNTTDWNNIGVGDRPPTEITADPKFVDQAGHNLRLQDTSPYIDQGVVVSNWTGEFFGNEPDIGRYENGTLTKNNWLLTEDGDALLTEGAVEIIA